MILTDFQRGKLPYFVAPPRPDGSADGTKGNSKMQSIKFVPASSDGETATDSASKISKEDDIARREESKKKVPGVRQDLTGIHVEPDFIDEDQQGTEGDVDGMEIEGEVEEDVELTEEEELSESEVVGDADLSSKALGELADDLKDDDIKTDCSKKGDTISEKEANEWNVTENAASSEETGSKRKLEKQKFEKSNVVNGVDVSTKLDNETANNDPRNKTKSKKKKTGYQDGEVSFKVLKTECSCCSEEENEEVRVEPIETIKKKVENENEEQILSSLTPEEKAFLGIDDELEEDGR